MSSKIKKAFLLIIFILLQSCSGGKVGNFLESSFKNIKEPKIEDTKNKIVINSEGNIEKIKNIKETKIKEDMNNNLQVNKVIRPIEKSKNNKKITKQNITPSKKQYKPQSYKIIFILKDVDPKDPIENLSTILRNSDVNFEIEKIERFFDSKNKI